MHTRNLQTLAIEMYEVSKSIPPKIFVDIFSRNSCANYNLHYQSEFSRPLVKLAFNGTETISYLGPRTWDLIPLKMKETILDCFLRGGGLALISIHTLTCITIRLVTVCTVIFYCINIIRYCVMFFSQHEINYK